jgi:hypothetical protein
MSVFIAEDGGATEIARRSALGRGQRVSSARPFAAQLKRSHLRAFFHAVHRRLRSASLGSLPRCPAFSLRF